MIFLETRLFKNKFLRNNFFQCKQAFTWVNRDFLIFSITVNIPIIVVTVIITALFPWCHNFTHAEASGNYIHPQFHFSPVSMDIYIMDMDTEDGWYVRWSCRRPISDVITFGSLSLTSWLCVRSQAQSSHEIRFLAQKSFAFSCDSWPEQQILIMGQISDILPHKPQNEKMSVCFTLCYKAVLMGKQ